MRNIKLDWPKIYNLPFKCALDTRTREFQYKLLNRILFTKSLLHKIGKKDSPLCSFCLTKDETIEHLFFQCTVVKAFWSSVQCFLHHHDLYHKVLNEVDIILGITEPIDHYIMTNHILLLAKQHIYKCSINDIKPVCEQFLKKT